MTGAQHVGRQVRVALAEHGRHQTDLAAELGLTPSALSRRTSGQVSFRADELIEIAAYLGVNPARFLQPIPAPRPPDQPIEAPATTARGAA